MTTRMATSTIKKAKLTACAWLVVQALLCLVPLACSAQFAQPLLFGDQNGDSYTHAGDAYTTPHVPLISGASSTAPNVRAQAGAPPPTGAGTAVKAVTAGDTGAPVANLPGAADMTNGNLFASGPGQGRTTVYILNQGTQKHNGRGSRMVTTLRPAELTASEKTQISSILGVNMDSGEAAIYANATEDQLSQIQQILSPYPGSQFVNGRTTITTDSPAANFGINKASNASRYDYQGPLPTVRLFARYLVILGVVAATIWMAMAAFSVVMGSKYGGARVISAAAGLMMLLCGYTIWKIVQMNTFKYNSNTPAVAADKAGGDTVSDAYINPTNLPGIPQAGRTSPARFGIPLVPLGGSLYR